MLWQILFILPTLIICDNYHKVKQFEVVFMVSFAPFRKLIQERGITTYYLRNKCGEYNLGNKTLERLMADQSVSTNTIDALCQILDCEVTDILEVIRDTPGQEE